MTSKDLREHVADAARRVPDLWEPYIEKSFARAMETNESKWDENYYGLQVVYLDTNFSKERYHHVIAVREKVGA